MSVIGAKKNRPVLYNNVNIFFQWKPRRREDRILPAAARNPRSRGILFRKLEDQFLSFLKCLHIRQIDLNPDPERLARHGLDARILGDTLKTAYYGTIASEICLSAV